MRVRKHNLNNCELYTMNLISKTPSHVGISIKANFPSKTSEVLFVIYSWFIGLAESFNTKNK